MKYYIAIGIVLIGIIMYFFLSKKDSKSTNSTIILNN